MVYGIPPSNGPVPVVLDAVGFMAFERSDFRVVPSLSGLVTLLIFTVTVGLTLLFGSSKTKDFLSIEIDEGKEVATKKSRLWLHLIVFFVGILSFLESWIESNGGLGPITDDGLSSNFIVDGLLFPWPILPMDRGRTSTGKDRRIRTKDFHHSVRLEPGPSRYQERTEGIRIKRVSEWLAIILLLTLSIVTVALLLQGTLVH